VGLAVRVQGYSMGKQSERSAAARGEKWLVAVGTAAPLRVARAVAVNPKP